MHIIWAPYSERAPGQNTESLLGCGATVSATIYYVPVLAAFMHILPTFAILYALLLPPLGQCFLLALPWLCLACLGSPDCAGWLALHPPCCLWACSRKSASVTEEQDGAPVFHAVMALVSRRMATHQSILACRLEVSMWCG